MKDTKEPLGKLIYHTSLEMSNLAEKLLKPLGLTFEQFKLLKSMALGVGLSQRDIGILVNKKPANITRILDRLETKNLVIRRDNPDDRRAMLVFITKMGLEMVEKVEKVFQPCSVRMFEGVSGDNQQVIRDSFIRMSANIAKMTVRLDQDKN